MMNKQTIFNIAYLLIVVAAASIFCFSMNVKKETLPVQKADIKKEKPDFDETCFTSIKKDTFIHLLQKAYDKSVDVNEKSGKIEISYTAPDQHAPDFYNGNDALLKYDLDDFGFKISKINTGLILTLKNKDNALNIPNDILIRLMAKYKLAQ